MRALLVLAAAPAEWARELIALALAAGAAAAVDRLAARRGFDPPGFRDPHRRLLAGLALAFVLFLGVFYPAATFDRLPEVDFEQVGTIQIFFFQLLLLGFLATWCGLAYAVPVPVPVPEADRSAGRPSTGGCEVTADPTSSGRGSRQGWLDGLGLRARHAGNELAIGMAWGLVGWLAVISLALAAGLVISEVGGEGAFDMEPAAQIVWLASLPVALRLAVSLSAGVVEELFFRGFLQPRIGVVASTALFVAAHAGYGQLFMLFGISLLSLFYAWLARWRRSVWAAMAAHFLFDAVQLLVVIPAALAACSE